MGSELVHRFVGVIHLTICAFCFALPNCLAHAESTDTPTPYRRIFVPADRPDIWPVADETYLPIEAEQLDALMSAAGDPGDKLWIEHIRLTGSLSDSNSSPSLNLQGEMIVAGSGPAFIPWPNRVTSIDNARWANEPQRPVRLGVWPLADGRQAFGLVAEKQGQLQFEAAAPRQVEGANSRYEIDLPTSADRRLTLVAPVGVRPLVANGVVDEIETESETTTQWRLRSAGEGAFAFELRQSSASTQAASDWATVATHSEAFVVEGGAEVRTEFLVQGSRIPRQLTLASPVDFAVTSVAVNGAPQHDWRVSPDETDRSVRVRLALEAGLTSAKIELVGWSAIDMHESWRMPRVSVEDAIWTEGDLIVRLAPEVRLADAPQVDGAVWRPLQSERQQRFAWQLLRGDPLLAFSFDWESQANSIAIEQDCRLSESETRCVASLQLSGRMPTAGEPMELAVAADWLVESVESESGLVEDWFLRGEKQGRTMVLQLAPSGVSRGEPSIVRIVLRRAALVDRPIAFADLAPIRLVASPPTRNVLRVALAPALEFVDRVAPLEVDLSGPFGAIDGLEQTVHVRREPERLNASTEIVITPKTSDARYDATVSIDRPGSNASPVASPTEPIRVTFRPPLPGEPEWTDASGEHPLEASRIESSGRDSRRETWEVRFPSPVAQAAVARVRTTLPNNPEGTRVPLASIDGAQQQKGTLFLQQTSAAEVWLDHAGLAATPTAKQAWRYTYLPTASTGQAAEATLRYGSKEQSLAALELLRLESVWHAGDDVLHRATFATADDLSESQTDETSRMVEFALPEKIQWIDAYDDRGVVLNSVPVGDGRRRVQFTDATKRLHLLYRASLPVNETTLSPTLLASRAIQNDWTWVVWASREWSLAKQTAPANWKERLFGPFAPGDDRRALNPFRGDDWRIAWELVERKARSVTRLRRRLPDHTPIEGWRSFQFAGAVSPPPPVELVDTSQRRGRVLALQIAVIAASVAWRFSGGRLGGFLVAAMVATMIAPASLADVASAVWFGGVLGWLLSWLLRRLFWSRPPAAAPRGNRRALTPQLQPTMLVLLLVMGAPLAAEPTAVLSDERPDQVEPVLIPIDQRGKLVGEKYYVRGEFLKSLMAKRKQRQTAAPATFVLQRASLRGELINDRTELAVRPQNWSFRLDLLTLRPNSRVSLPLRRDDARWPDTVMIDGLPTPLEWDDSGCAFVVEEPGQCIATISGIEPRVSVADGQPCISLQTPGAPGMSFTLSAPTSIAELQAPGALFLDRSSAGQLSGVLAAGEAMQLCWSAESLASTELRLAATAHQWLRVGPNEITLDVLVSGEGDFDPFAFNTPPGWTLVSTQQALGLQGTGGLIRFRADRKSPWGAVCIPPLTLRSAQVVRRLVALSSDASTAQMKPRAATASENVAPDDFASEWSDATGQPLVDSPRRAVMVSPDAAWIVAIQPPASPSRQQQLDLLVGEQKTELQLSVRELAPTAQAGAAPLLAFVVPESFWPESVTLTNVDEQIALDWRRPRADRLLVVRDERFNADSVLSIRGVVASNLGRQSAPLLRLASPDSERVRGGFEMRIARREGVSLDMHTPSRSSDLAPLGGWPVAELALSPGESLPAFTVAPITPVFDATVCAVVSEQRGGPHILDVAVELAVERGPLGIVRFDLAQPAMRLTSDPPQLLAPAGAKLRREEGTLRVQLAEPISAGGTETLRLRFSLPKTINSVERSVAMPVLVPKAPRQLRSCVALPATAEAGNASNAQWYAKEMRPLEDHSVFASLLPDAVQPHRVYETHAATGGEADRPRIERMFPPKSKGGIELPLVEHRLEPRRDVEPLLTSRYFLAPNGSSRILLTLDPGQRLDQVAIDGVRAMMRRIEAAGGDRAQWEVELASASLPQIVEVRILGRSPGVLGSPPQISSLTQRSATSQATVWSIARPDRALSVTEVQPPQAGLRPLSEREWRQLSLAAYSQLTQAVSSPPSPWAVVWRQQINNLFGAVDRDVNRDADPSNNMPRQFDELQQRIATWRAWDEESTAVNAQRTLAAMDENGASHLWDHYLATSTIDPVAISTPEEDDWTTRWLLALAITAVAIAVCQGETSAVIQKTTARYLHVVAALVGVAWWLWLEPSIVGLVIAVAAAVGQVVQFVQEFRGKSRLAKRDSQSN